MKILMIAGSFPPRYAGAVIQAIYLSKELKKQGMDVEFLVDNYEQSSAADEFEGLRVNRLRTGRESGGISCKFRELLFLARVFFFILRHNHYDIVFLHSVPGFTIFLFPLLKLIGKRTVFELTLVDNDDPLTLKKRKLGFLFYPSLLCATRIVAISSRLYDLSLEAGVKKQQLTRIPVGVDTTRFAALPAADKANLKAQLGYGNYPVVFVAVGQIEQRKGYEFMLEAWRTISTRLPDAVLLIAGPKNQADNLYFAGLLDFKKRYSLTHIHFLGLIPNVSDYMKIADCLLHCALAEGLPNTLIEAGASSVPIVCRHIEGVTSDIITSESIGMECKSDRPEDFADLAVSIVAKKENGRFEDASHILKERFDIREVAKRYIGLFKEMV